MESLKLSDQMKILGKHFKTQDWTSVFDSDPQSTEKGYFIKLMSFYQQSK